MTAQDQQSRAAELRATIDMLDECAKAGKPWPYVPSTESIRAVLDELSAAQVKAVGRVPEDAEALEMAQAVCRTLKALRKKDVPMDAYVLLTDAQYVIERLLGTATHPTGD